MYDPVRAQVALPRSFFLTLANWFPVPQLIGILLLLGAIVLAFCGFSVINPQSRLSPKHAWFWVLSAAAALGLFYALMVGADIHDAYGIGGPAIASPFIKHDGHIEPFSTHEAQAARHPRQPQNDAEAEALAGDVATKAYVALLPVLLFLGVYARYIFAGFHYFFVSHPAQEMIKTGLRSANSSICKSSRRRFGRSGRIIRTRSPSPRPSRGRFIRRRCTGKCRRMPSLPTL
jgi:hypothetical protein